MWENWNSAGLTGLLKIIQPVSGKARGRPPTWLDPKDHGFNQQSRVLFMEDSSSPWNQRPRKKVEGSKKFHFICEVYVGKSELQLVGFGGDLTFCPIQGLVQWPWDYPRTGSPGITPGKAVGEALGRVDEDMDPPFVSSLSDLHVGLLCNISFRKLILCYRKILRILNVSNHIDRPLMTLQHCFQNPKPGFMAKLIPACGWCGPASPFPLEESAPGSWELLW